MTKYDLVRNISGRIDGATIKDINIILDTLSQVIKEAVLAGDTVTIPEICKISSKDVAAKSGVAILDGEKMKWSKPAGKVGVVKALPGFKKIFEE